MVPISLPNLPKPSRTPGKAKNLRFRTKITKQLSFLINSFVGSYFRGPPGQRVLAQDPLFKVSRVAEFIAAMIVHSLHWTLRSVLFALAVCTAVTNRIIEFYLEKTATTRQL